MIISACGLICDECPLYDKTCAGCLEVKGQTFWAKDAIPNKICPLYDCAVNVKRFKDCGVCPELPCRMFVEQKDPHSSEEEHKAGIVKRVTVLKGRV